MIIICYNRIYYIIHTISIFYIVNIDFQVDFNKLIISMVLWNKIVLFLISLCMVALCDSTFQKPLDPFTLLRYDKRTPEDQPPNNEKNVSVEFDEYPVGKSP